MTFRIKVSKPDGRSELMAYAAGSKKLAQEFLMRMAGEWLVTSPTPVTLEKTKGHEDGFIVTYKESDDKLRYQIVEM